MRYIAFLPACLWIAAPAALAQTQLLGLTGNAPGDEYGASVAPIGDVNGDGIPDLAIGAPRAGVGGEVYVTSGLDGSVIRTLTAPLQLVPPDNQTNFGASLCALGDQDGDGIGEIVVGIPGQQLFLGERNGAVQVFSGATGISSVLAVGANSDSAFGATVAATRDMNGDGLEDLWIGAPSSVFDGERRGVARLFSVGELTYLTVIGGQGIGGRFSESLAVLPDVDGDGFDDIAVGSPADDTTFAAPVAGSVTTFSGATGAALYRIEGVATAEFLGNSLAAVPDANGDGITDLAIGVENGNVAGSVSGRVELRSGTDGSLILDIPGQNAFASFGESVAGLEDIDGDGAGEVLVGEPFLDGTASGTGAAHVISGATGQTIFSLSGEEAGTLLGRHVASAGDLDGDGFPEFVVSSSVNNGLATGAVAVYLGADAPVIRQCLSARPNSTGQVSAISFEGTASVAFNVATLRTNGLPGGAFGIYLGSQTYEKAVLPGGSFGQLCLGGIVGRFHQIRQASASGSFGLEIDLSALPTTNASVAAAPGETWHFQTWHRDIPTGVTQGTNFSDTVGVVMR